MATARVLIVDGGPVFAEAAGRLLRDRGYEVIPAASPRQALEIVRKQPSFDLALSDATMPGMCGTDFVREMTHISPQTSNVLICESSMVGVELPSGTRLLRKPFTSNDLLLMVRRVLSQSSMARTALSQACERAANLREQSRQIISEARMAAGSSQPIPGESGETLETAWQRRVQRAREVFVHESSAVKTAVVETHDQWISDDGLLKIHQACRAESKAIQEYLRVLRVFSDFVILGKIPQEDPQSDSSPPPISKSEPIISSF